MPSRTIIFIEPQGRAGRPFNAWIGRWPLLGPITLATILSERGYETWVYNENVSGPLPENAAAYAEVCAADVVGISIMTPTASRGYALADRLRRDAPNATVVFGGVHATFMPHEALLHGDVVVRGEGENVIEAIARGDITEGVIKAEPLEDLDTLPTLDYSAMRDFDKLVGRYHSPSRYPLPVMTSRGCPHNCTYCSVTRMYGRRVRRQSVEKVHRDLRQYADQGFRRVFFYDDNLTADRRWARCLLERIRSMRMRFNAQVRADFHWADRSRHQIDAPLLRSMRRGGADVLYIGYETIDDNTAAAWKKGYRGERRLASRLAEDTQILHDNGFWIHGMFVLGPQHTEKTARGIVDFARHNRIETMQISILTPFPGTPLYEQMRPDLMFTQYPADWDYYDGTHCVYGHPVVGVERFQGILLDAHRRFYAWGGSTLRRVRGLLESRITTAEKVDLMLKHARTIRTTFKQWRADSKRFLELLRIRQAEYVQRMSLGGAQQPWSLAETGSRETG